MAIARFKWDFFKDMSSEQDSYYLHLSSLINQQSLLQTKEI